MHYSTKLCRSMVAWLHVSTKDCILSTEHNCVSYGDVVVVILAAEIHMMFKEKSEHT